MKIEKNSLLKLTDNNTYLVLEKLVINGKKYLYLIDKDNRNNLKFYEETDDNRLLVVDNEKELQQIIPEFFKVMSANIIKKKEDNNQ
jgi:hypothetical protein